MPEVGVHVFTVQALVLSLVTSVIFWYRCLEHSINYVDILRLTSLGLLKVEL